MKNIVNYATNALLWHLFNNCGLNAKAAWALVEVINKLNTGEISLLSPIAKNTNCTVEEMLNDLHIEYSPVTPVTFYIEGKDILAVFYTEQADRKGNFLCYSHIGQHSCCSKQYVKGLKKAPIQKYLPLLRELEAMGYNLDIA